MALKVFMIENSSKIPEDFPAKVRATGAEFTSRDCQSDDEMVDFCREADYIITILGSYVLSGYFIKNIPKCRFIETMGVGVNYIDLEETTRQGIGLIHNPGFCREELSDHAMALVLSCARWIVGLNQRVKSGKPAVSAVYETVKNLSTLKNKTIGLIGLGNSGLALVPKARGFGMRVIAFDPYVNKTVSRQLNVEMVDLDRLYKESDFISIHASLTPETRGLIGLNEFKKMKRSVFIINTSRGAIIKEPDLCTALSEGYIAGAGLDVNDPEPVSLNSPLVKMENVILTGHNAGGSLDSYYAMWDFPIKELKRVMRNEWPVGLVNPEIKPEYMSKWGLMSNPID
jgi:D-3-phosphoglycerate dehydrogenase / 2-oxoglutarate reductase